MKKMPGFLYDLNEIKQRFEKGENVIQLLTQSIDDNRHPDFLDAVAISYDMQAGNYTKFAENNVSYKEEQTTCLAKEIKRLGSFDSILEAGVGECTTLAYLLKNIATKFERIFGFDISWSRLKYGRAFCNRFHLDDINLFAANLFQIPLSDNSIDVVHTFHSLEPNGGREIEAIKELYRVAKKYVVLCEPAYDFAEESAKQRMKQHGFACNIYGSVVELGYKIVDHRLFDVCFNKLNPTGITIIEKEHRCEEHSIELPFACPITITRLNLRDNCYFSKSSLLAYPIIADIPCLLSSSAVVATHYDDFN